MFKASPLKYSLPFVGTIFVLSVIFTEIVFSHFKGNSSFLLAVALIGSAVGAMLSGFFFWLGLSFSHRQPLPRRAVTAAIITYSLPLAIQQVLGKFTIVRLLCFCIVLVLPFVFGLRWPAAASANNSPKPTGPVGPAA